MKINPSQIDKLFNALAAESASSGSKESEKQMGAIGSTDSLTLSDAAKNRSEIDSAVNMVVSDASKNTSAERLLRFKSEIQNGTYRVPAEAIANAMIGNFGGET